MKNKTVRDGMYPSEVTGDEHLSEDRAAREGTSAS